MNEYSSLNDESVIAFDDRNLIKMKQPRKENLVKENLLKLDKIITEFHQKLEKLYGDKLINLVLYGSQARGDAKEDSDIDIMVVLKSPISSGDEIFRMGEIKNQLNLKYAQLISVFPISEEDFLSKQTPLLDNIRREGIIL